MRRARQTLLVLRNHISPSAPPQHRSLRHASVLSFLMGNEASSIPPARCEAYHMVSLFLSSLFFSHPLIIYRPSTTTQHATVRTCGWYCDATSTVPQGVRSTLIFLLTLSALPLPVLLPRCSECLPGSDTKIPVNNVHFVTGNPIQGPFEEGLFEHRK